MKQDVVRMKPFKLGEKVWKKGQVVQRLDQRSNDQRSNDVETEDGTLYRRNREDINETKEMPSVIIEQFKINDNDSVMDTTATIPVERIPTNYSPDVEKSPRRSNRERHMPKKFEDYILNK